MAPPKHFTIEHFDRRDDLCAKGQIRLRYCSDVGTIVKTKRGWYASNDVRKERIGLCPNSELVQPTVGPYKSAKATFEAYRAAFTTGSTRAPERVSVNVEPALRGNQRDKA